MIPPKDEKRIRVTVKCQDEAKLKLLCHKLLREARAHRAADLKFYFWQQAYHITRKEGAVPPLCKMLSSVPKQDLLSGMEWAFVLFGAACVGIATGLLF